MRPFPIAVLVLAAGCQLGLGDRIIQAKISPVSGDGKPLSGCALQLVSADTDGVLESKENVAPEYLNSFVNPPREGIYYFSLSCPGSKAVYKSARYSFSSGPYFHDLGVVPIDSSR
jgi:hypothetical protein